MFRKRLERLRLSMFILAINALRLNLLADEHVIDVYQRRVADPLQYRGVSLHLQVRALYVATALLCLFVPEPRLFNLAPSAIWLSLAIFVKFSYLDLPPADVLSRNPIRGFPFCVIRLFMMSITLFMLSIGLWYWILVAMASIAAACDPKPPRPRRVKVLIPAESL